LAGRKKYRLMKFKTLIILFTFALLVECFANAFDLFALQFISKPSLMLLLMVYFARSAARPSYLRNLILGALFFSWLGDVLLLLEKSFEWLFAFGLIAFLVAHVLYILFFLKIGNRNLGKQKMKPSAFLLVSIYSIVFYWILFPHLAFLKIPVFVYASAISAMLLTCIHAFDYERHRFGWICLTGTLFFAVSDSILAFNHFVSPIPFGGVFVIFLYGIGQLLITEGALRNLRKID